MRGYLRRVLISLDQFFNVVFLNGFPDETASSHWGRERKHKDEAAAAACAVLDALDPGHCEGSIEATPSGEIDSHHSGKVIYELPRDPAAEMDPPMPPEDFSYPEIPRPPKIGRLLRKVPQ